MLLISRARWLTLALLSLLAGALPAQEVPPPPAARLHIEPDAAAAGSGELKGTLSLHSVAGGELAAPKELTVELAELSEGVSVEAVKVTIPAGSTRVPFQIRRAGAGIIELRASNRELLPGSAFVRVKASQPAAEEAPPPPPPRGPVEKRHKQLKRTMSAPMPGHRPGRDVADDVGEPMSRSRGGGPDEMKPMPVKVRVELAPPPGDQPVRVKLFVNPQRPLASGHDPVTLQLFLADGSAASDLRISLHASVGKLEPIPILIRKGEDSARSTLSHDQPGEALIELANATPKVALDPLPIKLVFRPAISSLALVAPDRISVGDTLEIKVELRDPQKTLIKTDVDRVVSLSALGNPVELGADHLTIKAGEFFAPTTVRARQSGKVTLVASSEQLPDVTRVLQVSLPYLLLLTSALGGIVGGMLAAWRKKGNQLGRVGVGAATGFVLYWAAGHGLVAKLFSGGSLDQVGCFFFSIIGGWLGTKVFALILNRAREGKANKV